VGASDRRRSRHRQCHQSKWDRGGTKVVMFCVMISIVTYELMPILKLHFPLRIICTCCI
jgi:uncharacterized protein YqhQ